MLGFRSPGSTHIRTGLVHGTATRAAAVVQRRDGRGPALIHAAFAGRAKGMLAWRATQLMLQSTPRRKSAVSMVLDAADYQLLLTESLDLPPDELRAAIRWKIRDQIAFPAEEAVIDTFQLPAVRGASSMLQVVVTPPASIAELETIVRDTSRELDVIDIPELALRNLMTLMPQDSTGCLFVMLGRATVYILISCLGTLHVVRRIDAALGADADMLALDIQRSMQYYESQFDRAPINEIVLGPDNEQARAMAPRLAEACGVGCEVIDVRRLLECDAAVTAIDQPETLLAVAAALRPSTQGPSA
jgi:MSHA biogenesis protein MshI